MGFERFEDKKAVAWAKQIKARDNYICQVCKAYSRPLNSHHLMSWDAFEDLRYDLHNGITLCIQCHQDFHLIYGKGNNTAFQFKEFVASRTLILKALKQQMEDVEEEKKKAK